MADGAPALRVGGQRHEVGEADRRVRPAQRFGHRLGHGDDERGEHERRARRGQHGAGPLVDDAGPARRRRRPDHGRLAVDLRVRPALGDQRGGQAGRDAARPDEHAAVVDRGLVAAVELLGQLGQQRDLLAADGHVDDDAVAGVGRPEVGRASSSSSPPLQATTTATIAATASAAVRLMSPPPRANAGRASSTRPAAAASPSPVPPSRPLRWPRSRSATTSGVDRLPAGRRQHRLQPHGRLRVPDVVAATRGSQLGVVGGGDVERARSRDHRGERRAAGEGALADGAGEPAQPRDERRARLPVGGAVVGPSDVAADGDGERRQPGRPTRRRRRATGAPCPTPRRRRSTSTARRRRRRRTATAARSAQWAASDVGRVHRAGGRSPPAPRRAPSCRARAGGRRWPCATCRPSPGTARS